MADAHSEGGVLPDVHDEAANTPMWVPMLGLGLLTLFTVFLIVRAALAEDTESQPPEPPPAIEIAVD